MTTTIPSQESIRDIIESIDWHHSINLGNGLVTPGRKSVRILEQEAAHLPDVKGKSVLDIGAFDGWFSFEAERRGASKVVSLDHFMWGLDIKAAAEYMFECIRKGIPFQRLEETEYFHHDTLPGKRGYDLAHKLLRSKAQAIVCDYMEFEGQQFDVCLYNGVLYHMPAPLLALKKVAELTREVAMIETMASYFVGFEEVPLCEFFDRDNVFANDPTNYWSPNVKGLESMCRAVGFKKVDVMVRPPIQKTLLTYGKTRGIVGSVLRRLGLKSETLPYRYRIIVHAWK